MIVETPREQPETHPSLPRRAAIFVGEAVGTVQAAATVIKLAADYLFTPVSPLATSDKGNKDKGKGQETGSTIEHKAKIIRNLSDEGAAPDDIGRVLGSLK